MYAIYEVVLAQIVFVRYYTAGDTVDNVEQRWSSTNGWHIDIVKQAEREA